MKKKGYEQYFAHGIGHYLGLDVHDLGEATEPLEEGDIITIEPGIYIPEEQLGIRIEDDYWMTKKGLICLSESLPKKADDVEAMMQGLLQQDDEEGALIGLHGITVPIPRAAGGFSGWDHHPRPTALPSAGMPAPGHAAIGH